nr:unnamed protein product [Callosobruchus chinensis]
MISICCLLVDTQITTTASSAFQKIFLDIVGPLPTHSENFKYILTKQCELTKYVEAYPLLHKDSETVAKAFVQNFILRKEKVDQHRCSSYYSLGEKVLVHNSGSESKLEPIFKGPYIVLEDRDPNVILDLNGKQVEIIMECSRGQRIALMAINKQNESVPETINGEGDTSVLQTIDTNSMNCSEPSTEDEYLYQNAPIVLTTKNHQQVSQNPIDMPLFDIETIPVVLVAENNEIILDEALAESYLDSNSNAMITMEKTNSVHVAV